MNRTTRITAGLALAAASTALALTTATAQASNGQASNGQASNRQGDVRAHDLLGRTQVANAYGTPDRVSRRTGRGDRALSACTGETGFRDVVGDHQRLLHGTFRGHVGKTGRGFIVVEQIADQPTAGRAMATYRDILRQVRSCRHEPASHWHYGPTHRITSGAGTATWMSAINADGTRSGGYVVVVNGRHVGVVETSGAGGPRRVGQLAASAAGRLR